MRARIITGRNYTHNRADVITFIKNVAGDAVSEETIANWLAPGYLTSVTEGNTKTSADPLHNWLSNSRKAQPRHYEGYVIYHSVDGNTNVDRKREVSMLRISAKAPRRGMLASLAEWIPFAQRPTSPIPDDVLELPQHVHDDSDAVFIVVAGKSWLVSENLGMPIEAGMMVMVPRGVPHGFRFRTEGEIEIITIQSPPIRLEATETEDFHDVEQCSRTVRVVNVSGHKVTNSGGRVIQGFVIIDDTMPLVRRRAPSQ